MAGEIEDDPQTSLLAERNVVYSDDIIGKKGTKWSAVAHIITGVIGAGVLSLAWSIAQLGWIADSALGPTINHSLLEAARFYFGKKWTWVCGLLQYVSFYGTGIAYIITSATSMREIQRSNCYHKEGANADCHTGKNIFMLIFGIIQIVTSQIPDFHNMTWLSVVAALMSFCYSFIGLALGFSKVIDNRRIKGSIVGVPAKNAAQKIWLVFQALGDIAFAYPYSIILLEIQDTLKSPPPENQTMKKASISAIVITTFFYICCSGFGYAAFGNDTPGNLLTGFYEPFWLVDFANACIVLHLVGGYQVYSQPVFAFVEKKLTQKFPENKFLNKFYAIKLPVLPAFQLNFFRLCFRTFYVISTTAIAMAFPYFNQVLGILGALNFWPMTIYFPVEMYIVQRKIGAWTKKWLLLEGFSMICLIVSVVGLIGSIEGIISAKLAKV
ncbi:putative amino acid permease 7 isoform X4 [Nicotiana tabacum]|uniref:Amino acid permease 7 isoform X4 n=1 Tax=Nicotiana tabacum TaxID=4097 RepID=A0A1S3Z1U7_TOBAC|nr:PREDICTED: probable amino acid permease 7 isoform X4 [Nicotiana tabacum]